MSGRIANHTIRCNPPVSVVENKLISSQQETEQEYEAAFSKHYHIEFWQDHGVETRYKIQVQKQLAEYFDILEGNLGVVGTWSRMVMIQMTKASVATNLCLMAHWVDSRVLPTIPSSM